MSIEDRLRTQLGHAGQTIPVVALDVEETLTKGRHARRVAFARTAGAAAIVIGLGIAGATSLMNGDAPRPIPPVDRSPSPPPHLTERGIESVLRSWLQAIQNGDENGAWAMMTEGAQSDVGREHFDELMASALPEGLGAFADPDVEVDLIELDEVEGDPGLVATLSGSVQREGTTEFAVESIPMRSEGGQSLVDETFEVRDEVMTVWTSANLGATRFRVGRELPIEAISPDIERVYLSIDGTSPALPARFDPSSGSAVVTLDRTLDAGLHIATIVMIDEEGRMFPQARPFEAAAP